MSDLTWKKLLMGGLELLYKNDQIIGSVGIATNVPLSWAANYVSGTETLRIPNTENFEKIEDAKQAVETWISEN